PRRCWRPVDPGRAADQRLTITQATGASFSSACSQPPSTRLTTVPLTQAAGSPLRRAVMESGSPSTPPGPATSLGAGAGADAGGDGDGDGAMLSGVAPTAPASPAARASVRGTGSGSGSGRGSGSGVDTTRSG